MAKIYAIPTEVPLPDPDYKNYDHLTELICEELFLQRLREWCRARFPGDLVGEEVSTPRADGYARYMIMREKPFAMIHLMLGDAWCAEPEWERGMRLSDARKRIEGERKFRAAWAEAK